MKMLQNDLPIFMYNFNLGQFYLLVNDCFNKNLVKDSKCEKLI